MSGLIDPTMTILTHALDGLTSQQSAISSNLANIDTPNYQPKTVDFESTLQSELASMSGDTSTALPPSAGPSADSAMERTDSRHFSLSGSLGSDSTATVSTTSENTRNDGNKVDLESEMTSLTQTQIKYEADSRLLTGKFDMLYDVLGGH